MALFKADISRWEQLEVLDLSGNLFEYLPASIGFLPALQELNVMNIPTLRIPASVMQVCSLSWAHGRQKGGRGT